MLSNGGFANKGVRMYQNGGVGTSNAPDVKVIAKDSYLTSDKPQVGEDYIIMVDGQPTDYRIKDMANFYRSYGLDGKQLDTVFDEFMGQFPKSSRTEEEERAYRSSQFNKALADVGAIARGDADEVKTVTPGAFSKDQLGNVLREVYRGGEASRSIGYTGRSVPTGQTGTPRNVDTDAFLRALSRNYGN